MRKKSLLYGLSICLFFFCNSSIAQSQEQQAQQLVKRHIASNKAKQTMPGYRVQLFFGANRSKAYEVRTDFVKVFSTTPAYVVYHQPNFKVRVGDFKTRLEAVRFLKEAHQLFDNAFIVRDEIKIPGL
jgi:SPOR domain